MSDKKVTKEYADACARLVKATHMRKIVLCNAINTLAAAAEAAGDKVSEQKLDRLARDTAEYKAAVDELAEATREERMFYVVEKPEAS